MTIVERLQRAIDDEPFMLGGEHDLLRDALNEIEIQRGIIERLRADLATQQGCCDGAAAQDAHVRQEREEHRDEVKRLSAEMDAMRLDKNNVISTWRGRAGRAEIEKDKLSIERAKLLAENERLRAENERLDNEDTKTRHALGGWVFVPPDGGAEPTHERVAAVVAEVERLRAERDALRIAAREYLQTAGGAIQSGKFDMTGTADTAHFTFELVGTTDMAHVMRQAMQRLYSLAFDRAEPCPTGLETLREPDKEDGR